LFTTSSKDRIGSYLSWPVGAERISIALAEVPQASIIKLTFSEHWPKYHQGKWPLSYSVFKAEYCRYRNMHRIGESSWAVCVRPVPRDQRAKVKEALESKGFTKVADWLSKNAGLSGREGKLAFEISWNSELEELSYVVNGMVVPEVTTDAAIRQNKSAELHTSKK